MYKFWIKTGVSYPKMYIWFRKMEKFVFLILKIKFLPKNLTKLYKFWIKTGVLYTKRFDQNVQIWDKYWSFLPKKCTFGPEKTKNLYFLH